MKSFAALLVCAACGRVAFAPVSDGAASDGATNVVKAFPTAEGFGANTPGGRGGRVIAVTNLNDSGPGSLREAVSANEPRIVVFRVAGVIDVTTAILIEHSFITIAGQSAPGEGVVLTGDVLSIQASDVIVRHFRVRPADNPANRPDNSDAVSVLGNAGDPVQDVILDHVSASWAPDDVLSLYASNGPNIHRVTVQWSLIAEGLHCDYIGSSGCVASGSIVGYGVVNASLHHNLWAHHAARTPELLGTGGCTGCDVVNNTTYNWSDRASGVGSGTTANFVGNTYRRGPVTPTGFPTEMWVLDPSQIFVEGNVASSITSDQWGFTFDGSGYPAPTSHRASTRFATAPITEESALEAYTNVLADAGATKPMRDSTDQRIVLSVTTLGGQLVSRVYPQTATDSPYPGASDVGGFPVYSTAGTPYPDQDGDGMDDAWEAARGLDPANPADGALTAPNGYTHVENFLNELAGDPPAEYP